MAWVPISLFTEIMLSCLHFGGAIYGRKSSAGFCSVVSTVRSEIEETKVHDSVMLLVPLGLRTNLG